MDRGLVIAGIGVVGTLGTIVALVALLTAGGAQLAFSSSPAPEPHRVSRVARAAREPVAAVTQVDRARAGRARQDGTRVASAAATRAPAEKSQPADDLWIESPSPVAPVAVVDDAPPVDPDEDMSDFELVLGSRGGGDTGRGR